VVSGITIQHEIHHHDNDKSLHLCIAKDSAQRDSCVSSKKPLQIILCLVAHQITMAFATKSMQQLILVL